MIASIEFTNFKILRSARIELAPFNLIIGPNGSGKTSVLVALQRLRQFAGRPPQFVAKEFPASKDCGQLLFRFQAPFDDLTAQLECAPDGTGRALRIVGGHDAPARWPALMARLAAVRVVALEQAALARPSPAGAPILLGDDGTNLPAALDRLQREEPETFARIVAEFCRILPEYRSLGCSTLPDGTRRLGAEIVGESRTLGAEELSQGTLVLIGLLAFGSVCRATHQAACNAPPSAAPSSSTIATTGTPKTSAMIWRQTGDLAPPPVMRISLAFTPS